MEPQVGLSTENILTILGGVGVIFGGFYGLLSRRFNKVDADIKDVRAEVKDVKDKLASFEKSTEHRFGKVETRLSVMETELKNNNQRLTDFQFQVNQRLSSIEGHLLPSKVYEFKEPRRQEEEPKEN